MPQCRPRHHEVASTTPLDIIQPDDANATQLVCPVNATFEDGTDLDRDAIACIERARPYACTLEGCGKRFTQKGNLATHIATVHDRQRRFSCPRDGCCKVFSQKANLDQHIAAVHDKIRAFECSHTGCEATFTSNRCLKQHVSSVHNGEPLPFPCPRAGCDASFQSKSSLDLHISRVHDGHRPHQCQREGCDMRFTAKGDLIRHVALVHNGHRPYHCDVEGCGFSFGRRADLNMHITAVHVGDRPFICGEPGCDFASSQRGNLVRHTRAMHTTEGQQRQKRSENAVAKALAAAGIAFKREHHIDFKCADATATDSFFRVDFIIAPHHGTLLCIECDERQHAWIATSCDVKRMAEVVETLAVGGNELPVAFIRFNPDAFRRDGALQSIPKKARHAALVRILGDATHALWTDPRPLAILHMFYDTGGAGETGGADGAVETPLVVAEYGPLSACVLPCVATA